MFADVRRTRIIEELSGLTDLVDFSAPVRKFSHCLFFCFLKWDKLVSDDMFSTGIHLSWYEFSSFKKSILKKTILQIMSQTMTPLVHLVLCLNFLLWVLHRMVQRKIRFQAFESNGSYVEQDALMKRRLLQFSFWKALDDLAKLQSRAGSHAVQ